MKTKKQIDLINTIMRDMVNCPQTGQLHAPILINLAKLQTMILVEKVKSDAKDSQPKEQVVIYDTDKQAIKEALNFMYGFYDDDTQPNIKAIVDNLHAFYNAIAPKPVSTLSDHDNPNQAADGKPLAIDEWSSRSVGNEVYLNILHSWAVNDLQVTRILCNALDADHQRAAMAWFNDPNNRRGVVDNNKLWFSDFIECFNDYCNGK